MVLRRPVVPNPNLAGEVPNSAPLGPTSLQNTIPSIADKSDYNAIRLKNHLGKPGRSGLLPSDPSTMGRMRGFGDMDVGPLGGQF